MSLTARRAPGGASSSRVMKMFSSAAGGRDTSVGLLQPRPRHLPLDHRRQQAHDLTVSHDLHVPGLISLSPIGEPALLGELVEVRTRQDDLEPCIPGLPLADLRAGYADAIDL